MVKMHIIHDFYNNLVINQNGTFLKYSILCVCVCVYLCVCVCVYIIDSIFNY